MKDRSVAIASLLAAVALLPGPSAAQAYPVRPVKIVVPAQPGGGLDLIGRTVAGELGRAMAQSFVVENVAGGGGVIASMATARAAPDGYTLMVGYVGTAPIPPSASFRTTPSRTTPRSRWSAGRPTSWSSLPQSRSPT
jgi:tripartite-type tricarboxylate transporter receptor subunit TctC